MLQLLRHSTEAAQGCTGDALDMAIDMMQRSIVKADIESIIKAVVRETGVTDAELCAKGRHRERAEARAIVAWLAYNYTSITKTSIGERMNRNHATVVHYTQVVDEWLEEPRRNLRGARIITRLMRELEDA